MKMPGLISGDLRPWWRRVRVPLVMIPLLVCLGVAGSVGAAMLWASSPGPAATPRLSTCWDRAELPASECSQPDGTRGLEYVFPEFDSTASGCKPNVTSGGRSDRVLEWRCTTTLHGHDVEIAYRERPSVKRGLRFLKRFYADADRQVSDDGARLIWRPAGPNPSGRYVYATAYKKYPFSLTLRTDTLQLRDEATRTLVHARKASRMTVRPATSNAD